MDSDAASQAVKAVRDLRPGEVLHFLNEPFYVRCEDGWFDVLWLHPAPDHRGFRFYSELTVAFFLFDFTSPKTPIIP